MSSAPRVPGRLLLAGLTASVVLTGCGGEDEPDGETASPTTTAASTTAPSPSAPSASAPSTTGAGEPGLASGLLPAEAFGPGATVVALSPDQLEQGAGLAAEADELQITPESCRGTVEGMQPDVGDFADVAAQTATTGASSTLEMLLRGGPPEGTVAELAEAAQRCPTAQVTSQEIGQATVTFENFPVEDVGDGAALLRYTTSVSAPGGAQVSLPTLVGAVEDGDRLLLLVNIDTGGDPAAATDPAAFADLLERAYRAQADALG